MSATERVPAPLLVLTAIVSVQVGSSLAKQLFDDLGAAGVTLLRLGLAAALLLAVLRPKVRSWSRASWQAALLLGGAMAGMNLVFYLSLRTVPLGVAVTVEFLGPLLLALVQTRRAVDLLWAALAAGGVALLGLDSSSGAPLSGLLLAFVAGLFWAAYIVASARVGQVLPGTDGLAVALAFAALLVLPFGLSGASAVVERPVLLLAALGVALMSSVISYGLELAALRRIPTQVFGILMSLEPAAAAVAGLVVLGEELGVREVVALVLVSLASGGITLARRREDRIPVQPLE
ncbi:MAG: ywfM-like transporter [Frankiales bacterium]|nr:ywfM-like transporter [Frankiales bacterium]